MTSDNEKKIKKTLDRRWLFVLIFVGVAIPLIIPLGLPLETTENSRLVYQLIDSTPSGSEVILSFDFDPASKPELFPMALSIVRHCFDKGQNVIITALWPMGVQMAESVFSKLESEYPHVKYGENYVNLGFKAGGIVTIQAMGKDFRSIFPTDMNGTSIDELPIMDGIKDFSNIGFVCSFSAGDPGIKQWVQIAHDTYNRPVTGGVTGVSAPAILPYVNEQKQLYGLLAGLKAAAEYESLIDIPGAATSGMDAQSIAHLIIIIFIAMGNIIYWKNKRKGGE